MTEYACVFASGARARGLAHELMERGLALRVDIIKFTIPLLRKNGKIKLGTEDYSVQILVPLPMLREAMDMLASPDDQVVAYALPVLATVGVNGPAAAVGGAS